MHEMSMARDIIGTVTEIMKEHPGKKVTKIHLKIGEMAGVVVDSLLFSYQVSVEDTPLSSSTLEIETVETTAQCKNCGSLFKIEELDFFCHKCSSPDIEVKSGNELYITNLEIE